DESIALVYSRFNHPNAEILEDQILPLEPQAKQALVFNSGMSAIHAALAAYLRPGAAIVYTVPIYGGTQKLIQAVLEPWGVKGVPVRAGDTVAMEKAIAKTKDLAVVLIETPANPTLTMTDIQHAADCAAKLRTRPLVMVDNTMMGPTLQHPFLLGADVVLYSATKYLSGFSDLIGGVALTRAVETMTPIRGLRSLFGTILQPDECWILNSRLLTVGPRIRQATESARQIVGALAKNPKVARIYYPTQFEVPAQIRIRDAQCEGPGAMFSIELKGGKRAAFDFLRRVKIARNAVSLGGVETLVCHPKSTTHSGFTVEEFKTAGVTDALLRVSIGLEDARDLLADFEQALG
ncbi:MAG TPA: aminotransferase class I/II-fold pyridoxal phosphate-dependent enzyme, partial [Alphaproteobacteria bacterium]|nr:aminotransferase class I/II-fold pyridoxal phosphate-dependent enzyme [Alphaproteobacteria bacterium]